MLRMRWELLLLAIIYWQRGQTDISESKQGHVSVVIVGGTGDLARKYLWQGFFQLYADQVGKGHTFSFYAGALSPDEKGTAMLFGILKELACPPELSAERCALVKEQFLHLSQYRQLKTLEDYEKLNQHIKQQMEQEGMVEAGRLFYLSVPAFTYADIAEKINSTCRPAADVWLRVVLEKPFGHDFNSAQFLAKQLSGSLYSVSAEGHTENRTHISPQREWIRKRLPLTIKKTVESMQAQETTNENIYNSGVVFAH